MKHAHAALLHRLADDPSLPVWSWYTPISEWESVVHAGIAADKNGNYHYALGDKPTSPPKKYAMVEGVRVPMTHLTVAPKCDAQFWFVSRFGSAYPDTWQNCVQYREMLANKNVYATEADAQEAGAAWAQVRKIAAENAK